MALIYASAVNRRMNALQKKHSMDITSSQQQQHPHEIVHRKQQSNEERQQQFVNGQQQSQQQPSHQFTRKGSLDRKRSAPQPFNRVAGPPISISTTVQNSPGTANASANGRHVGVAAIVNNHSSEIQRTHQHQLGNNNKSCVAEHAKVGRKITVACGNEGTGGGRGGGGGDKHQRKISTPAGAGWTASGASAAATVHNKEPKRSASKANSPECEVCREEERHYSVIKAANLLATFGRAVRRRSVSADESAFRRRLDTNGSLDSYVNPVGDGGRGGTESPGARKTSAFQKMKERLNRWKLSG